MSAATKITAAGIPIMRQSAQEREEDRKPKTGKEKYQPKRARKMRRKPPGREEVRV